MNDHTERWLAEVANVGRPGTTREWPLDRFERDERTALKPVARHPYRRVGAAGPSGKASRGLPKIGVERRLVRAYAELAR